MTTVIDFPARRIPQDSFPVRLAIVRAEMTWNYDQAAAATGINSETWRLWEKRQRRCNDIEAASRAIEKATGYSYEWLMCGGPLQGAGPDGGGHEASIKCMKPRGEVSLIGAQAPFALKLAA